MIVIRCTVIVCYIHHRFMIVTWCMMVVQCHLGLIVLIHHRFMTHSALVYYCILVLLWQGRILWPWYPWWGCLPCGTDDKTNLIQQPERFDRQSVCTVMDGVDEEHAGSWDSRFCRSVKTGWSCLSLGGFSSLSLSPFPALVFFSTVAWTPSRQLTALWKIWTGSRTRYFSE